VGLGGILFGCVMLLDCVSMAVEDGGSRSSTVLRPACQRAEVNLTLRRWSLELGD
jgi:hypothetical protein